MPTLPQFRVLRLLLTLLAATTAMHGSGACAADWKPDRRIEIVVPNAPGGGNDRIVRTAIKIAQENRLVDPVMTVVNKPGAGTVMGLNYLNQHPGDGHFLAIISATYSGDVVSGRSSTALADITPIAQLFTEYVGFAVKPDSPIQTGKDLIARLKADPGAVSTGMAGGVGSHNYVALALVARAAGGDLKKLKIVVFNGGAEAITAAIGGHVDLVVSPAATILPHARSGNLRLIAISAPKRLQGPFAAVPAWKELGADAVASNWRCMVGPRGMTPPQLAYWENVFARVADSGEWRAMLERDLLSGEFLRGTEARNAIKAELDDIRAVMMELGVVKQ